MRYFSICYQLIDLAIFYTLHILIVKRRIRLAGVFGAGLLVGTALCVIIPEGVHTITDHSQTKHPLLEKSGNLALSFKPFVSYRYYTKYIIVC